MADLGQLLGTLLASLAHARRIADEETAAIAERYKDHPLLEGLSLPRIRVPELVLEMPMLIQSHDEGMANIPEDTDIIVEDVVEELEASALREGVSLQAANIELFKEDLAREINKLSPSSSDVVSFPREVVIRAVDKSFTTLVKRELAANMQSISPGQAKNISTDIRTKASQVALKEVGSPPTIEASIITAEVKDEAGAGNVSRLRIVMREEGLEWSVSQNEDGSITQALTPE